MNQAPLFEQRSFPPDLLFQKSASTKKSEAMLVLINKPATHYFIFDYSY